MRVAQEIHLSDAERKTLEQWSQGRCVSVRHCERAKIILLASEGLINIEIAAQLKIQEQTVGRWRKRFAELRIKGIEKDLPRGGRPRAPREKLVSEIIRITTQETPEDATHWSTRSLANKLGVNQTLISRVWRAHGLKPHLVRTFKLSNDPRFEEKLRDVIGLYMNPPENALVLSADEKSQIQALDRTQPSLPIVPGRCGTMTHDYKRNGTTTLFAAIDMLKGKVIASCMPRHRHQEWIKFLKQINRETPKGLDIHIVADNYSTHKHPNVKKWLESHARFTMHFIPTSSSWLNVIERFFRDLDGKRLRRGIFKSVSALIKAIKDYIGHHNQDPRPFIWRKTAEEIIEKVGRARLARDNGPTE